MGLGDALKFLAPAPSLPSSPSPSKRAASSASTTTSSPSPAPRRTAAGRRVLLTNTLNSHANANVNAAAFDDSANTKTTVPPPDAKRAPDTRSWVGSDYGSLQEALPVHDRVVSPSRRLSKQPRKRTVKKPEERSNDEAGEHRSDEGIQRLDDRVSGVCSHTQTPTHSRSGSGSSSAAPSALTNPSPPSSSSSPHLLSKSRPLTKVPPTRTTPSPTSSSLNPEPIPTPASVLLPLHTHTYHVLLYHPISSSSFISDEERVNADVGWDWVVVASGGGIGGRLESVVTLSTEGGGEGDDADEASDGVKRRIESRVGRGEGEGYGQRQLQVSLNAQWPLLKGKEACIWKGAGEVLERGTWIVLKVAGREYLGRVVGVVGDERVKGSIRPIPTPLPLPGDTYISPPSLAAYDARTAVQFLLCVLGEVALDGSSPAAALPGPSLRFPGKGHGHGSTQRRGKVLKRSSTTVFEQRKGVVRRVASAQISRADDRKALQQKRKGCGVGLRNGGGGGGASAVDMKNKNDDEDDNDDESGMECNDGALDSGEAGGEGRSEAGYEMVETFEEWKEAQVGDVREVREGGRRWWMRVVRVLEVGDGRGAGTVGREEGECGKGEGIKNERREREGEEGKEGGEGERPYSWTPPEAFILDSDEKVESPSPHRSPSSTHQPPHTTQTNRTASSQAKPTKPTVFTTITTNSSANTSTSTPATPKASPLLPSLTPKSTPRYKYRPATTPRGRKVRSEGALGGGIGIGIGRPGMKRVGSNGTKDGEDGGKGDGTKDEKKGDEGENRETGEKPRVPTVRLVKSPVVEDKMPDLKPADMRAPSGGSMRVVSISRSVSSLGGVKSEGGSGKEGSAGSETKEGSVGKERKDGKSKTIEGKGKGSERKEGAGRPRIWEMFAEGGASKGDTSEAHEGEKKEESVVEKEKKDEKKTSTRKAGTLHKAGSPSGTTATPHATLPAPASPALSTLSLSVPPSPTPSPRLPTTTLPSGSNPTPIWSALARSPHARTPSPSPSADKSPRLPPVSLSPSRLKPAKDGLGSPRLGLRSLVRTLSKTSLKDDGAHGARSPAKSHLGLPPSAFRAPLAVGSASEGEGEGWDVLDKGLGLESFDDPRVSPRAKAKNKDKANANASATKGLPEIRGVPRLSVGFIEKALGGSQGSLKAGMRSDLRGGGAKTRAGGAKESGVHGEKEDKDKEMKWSEYVSLKRSEGEGVR